MSASGVTKVLIEAIMDDFVNMRLLTEGLRNVRMDFIEWLKKPQTESKKSVLSSFLRPLFHRQNETKESGFLCDMEGFISEELMHLARESFDAVDHWIMSVYHKNISVKKFWTKVCPDDQLRGFIEKIHSTALSRLRQRYEQSAAWVKAHIRDGGGTAGDIFERLIPFTTIAISMQSFQDEMKNTFNAKGQSTDFSCRSADKARTRAREGVEEVLKSVKETALRLSRQFEIEYFKTYSLQVDQCIEAHSFILKELAETITASYQACMMGTDTGFIAQTKEAIRREGKDLRQAILAVTESLSDDRIEQIGSLYRKIQMLFNLTDSQRISYFDLARMVPMSKLLSRRQELARRQRLYQPEPSHALQPLRLLQYDQELVWINEFLKPQQHLDVLSPKGSATGRLIQMLSSMPNEIIEQAKKSPAMQVAFAGEYSAGKTSLLKRILMELKGTKPNSNTGRHGSNEQTLEIRADPTTTTSTVFKVNEELHFVDTPGFQSQHWEHDEAAERALSIASLIVVTVPPQIVTGNSERLVAAICSAIDGPAPPIIFCVARCDELGADPLLDLKEYRERCHRKVEEAKILHPLLISHRSQSPLEIISIAGDPFGLLSSKKMCLEKNTNDRNGSIVDVDNIVSDVKGFELSRFSEWDGVKEVFQSIQRMTVAISPSNYELIRWRKTAHCAHQALLSVSAVLELERIRLESFELWSSTIETRIISPLEGIPNYFATVIDETRNIFLYALTEAFLAQAETGTLNRIANEQSMFPLFQRWGYMIGIEILLALQERFNHILDSFELLLNNCMTNTTQEMLKSAIEQGKLDALEGRPGVEDIINATRDIFDHELRPLHSVDSTLITTLSLSCFSSPREGKGKETSE